MKAIGHLSIGYPGSEVDEEFELDDDISEEDGLDEDDRKEIRSIPNYDREIFEEITGINTGDGNG